MDNGRAGEGELPMHRWFQICGGLALAAAALVGCESLWVGYKTPNPASCEAPGYGCAADEVCNPQTRQCESRLTTLLHLSITDPGSGDGGLPTTCSGPVTYQCEREMFCVQAPLGTGPTRRLYAVSESDIWAVSGSRILHYDGKIWNTVTSCGAQSAFVDVYAASNTDVWVIEGRRIVRLQGGLISEVATDLLGAGEQLRAVFGVSGRVWFVGTGGTILQWDGSKLTRQVSGTTANLQGIFGPDGQNLWAVGDSGTILRYNGTSWAAVTSGTTAHLNAVHGRSANSIVVVGSSGTVLTWNGTAFASALLAGAPELLGVSVSGDGSGWIVAQSGALFRSVAGAWSLANAGGFLARPNYDVWNFSLSSAAMVGGNSRSVRSRWNGTTWVDSFDELLPAPQAMGAITTPVSGAIAMGQGLDGSTYSITSDFVSLGSRVQIGNAGWVGLAMWVDPAPTGNRLAWVVGKSGLSYSYDGTTWTSQPTSVSDDLVAISGVNANAVWAVGSDASKQNGRVIAWNGISWVILASMSLTNVPMSAVAAVNGQAYVAGKGMALQSCSSSSCSPITTTGTNLGTQTAYAIWTTQSAGSSGLDIWVAGTGGNIYRYKTQGDTVTPFGPVETKTTKTLRHIFGKNHSDFYVVGDGGTILKWNGTAFAVVRTDTVGSVTAGVVLPNGTPVMGGASAGWLTLVQ